MGFSYVIQTPRFSVGNRIGYRVKLTDIANDGTSIVKGLPFKKITGVMCEETATGTSAFTVSTAESQGHGLTGTVTVTSSAGTEDGEIFVVGLL